MQNLDIYCELVSCFKGQRWIVQVAHMCKEYSLILTTNLKFGVVDSFKGCQNLWVATHLISVNGTVCAIRPSLGILNFNDVQVYICKSTQPYGQLLW